jgi:hypothetical protein
MAKRLLTAWAIFAGGFIIVGGDLIAAAPQTGPAIMPTPGDNGPAAPHPSGHPSSMPVAPPANGQPSGQSPSNQSPSNQPTARLIKPRGDTHAADRPRPRPLDERCRPLKDQLEAALQKPGDAHRVFQARLAHNAGNRLCREGHADRGMAEFQRGLSYFQENPPSVAHDASSDR